MDSTMSTYDGGYSTHIEALAWAASRTTGPILEWGCGYYSTPLLHGIAEAQGRKLYTMEAQEGWLELFLPWKNEWHHLNRLMPAGQIPGLVFVDDESWSRPIRIQEAHDAQMVVVHDTEPESAVNYPGMEEAMAEYRYRKDYKKFQQWTTVLSDHIDLGE